MNTPRDRLLELQPVLGPHLADPKWDHALIGYARRAREVLPVYSWAAARSLDPGHASELLQSDRWLLLHSGRSWRDLWRVVQELGLPRWDQLDKAVVGFVEARNGHALVYSMPLAVDMLRRSQMASEDGMDPVHAAILFVENRLLPVNIGPQTSWFLTPV